MLGCTVPSSVVSGLAEGFRAAAWKGGRHPQHHLPVTNEDGGRRCVGVGCRRHLLLQALLLGRVAAPGDCVQGGSRLVDSVVLLHDAALLLLLRTMRVIRAHAHSDPSLLATHDSYRRTPAPRLEQREEAHPG